MFKFNLGDSVKPKDNTEFMFLYHNRYGNLLNRGVIISRTETIGKSNKYIVRFMDDYSLDFELEENDIELIERK